MTNTFRTSAQSGRSMVEMLGVLAIIGVLSIGGVAGYSKAMAKYKINKTMDQVSLLITAVRTAYGASVSYKGLDTKYAIQSEMVGMDMTLGSKSKIQNAYQGGVIVQALDKNGKTCGTADTDYCPMFGVAFTGIDKLACAQLASADWGGSPSSGLYAIRIGTERSIQFDKDLSTAANGIHTWEGTTTAQRLPVEYAQALSECLGTNISSNQRTNANAKSDIAWIYF